MAAIGHPILGDKLYLGGDELFLRWLDGRAGAEELAELGLDRQALHAWRLEFSLPDRDVSDRSRRVTLEAPLWPDMRRLAGAPQRGSSDP